MMSGGHMTARSDRRHAQRDSDRVRAGRRFGNGIIVALAAILTMRGVHAHDAFDAVKCDGDVIAALSGKHLGKESDDGLEKKHASIGLKVESGEIISDDLNYA